MQNVLTADLFMSWLMVSINIWQSSVNKHIPVLFFTQFFVWNFSGPETLLFILGFLFKQIIASNIVSEYCNDCNSVAVYMVMFPCKQWPQWISACSCFMIIRWINRYMGKTINVHGILLRPIYLFSCCTSQSMHT